MFAVLDGGQSLEAPKLLRPIIPSVMVSEMRKEEGLLSEGVQLQDSLQYLAGTFLTAHRWEMSALYRADLTKSMYDQLMCSS